MTHAANPSGTLQVRRYLSNVVWSWAGVAVTLVVGFFLSPFIIHRIGDGDFGVWTLTLSLVEYYWLIDLGFRSATLKYSAQYRVEGNIPKLNELLSTGLVYSAISGALLFVGILVVSGHLGAWLHIHQPVFPTLVRIIGLSWALGLVFNRYSAFLEGFQRFDITSRIWIISMVVRTAGLVVLLLLGYGLVQMALMLMASQLLTYLLNYVDLRRLFKEHAVRWSKATRSMLKQMASYGVHSLTILVSTRLLNQSTPFLIAFFLPVRFVAYYAVPAKLLDYAMEAVSRIGMVTAPSAAALQARGGSKSLLGLGVYANRYCLTIYLPMTVMLSLYGFEFLSLWIRPDFAYQSAGLFRILLIGGTAVAGQFNSASILCGLGTHKTYSRTLFVEALLGIAAMLVVIPRYGILGAGAVATVLMFINRGVVCGILAARELGIPPLKYLSHIYSVPLSVGAFSMAALYWVKSQWLPGRTWFQLVAAVAIFGILYLPLTYRFTLAADHRRKITDKLSALAHERLGRNASSLPKL